MDGFITLISQRINWFYGFFFLYTNFIQIIEMIGKNIPILAQQKREVN
jgi:hypothetical protein